MKHSKPATPGDSDEDSQSQDDLSEYFDALLNAPALGPEVAPPQELVLTCFRIHGLILALEQAQLLDNIDFQHPGIILHPEDSLHIADCLYRGAALPVVDIASIILPEDLRANGAEPPERRCILLCRAGIGIVCDELLTPQRVGADALCWRNADSQRLWLAATIRSQQCAVIDVPGLITALCQAGLNCGPCTRQS